MFQHCLLSYPFSNKHPNAENVFGTYFTTRNFTSSFPSNTCVNNNRLFQLPARIDDKRVPWYFSPFRSNSSPTHTSSKWLGEFPGKFCKNQKIFKKIWTKLSLWPRKLSLKLRDPLKSKCEKSACLRRACYWGSCLGNFRTKILLRLEGHGGQRFGGIVWGGFLPNWAHIASSWAARWPKLIPRWCQWRQHSHKIAVLDPQWSQHSSQKPI